MIRTQIGLAAIAYALSNAGPASAQTPCHPAYQDVCLTPGIGDYDCEGGSGDGPNYVQGSFRLSQTGIDPFLLDRDSNGIGCEG